MIKVNTTINSIKEAVKNLSGKNVTVKLNLGRNKFVTFPAVVNGIYPSLFTVSPFDKNFLAKPRILIRKYYADGLKFKKKFKVIIYKRRNTSLSLHFS